MSQKFEFKYGDQVFKGRNEFLWNVWTFLDKDYDGWNHEEDNTKRFHTYEKEWTDDDDNNIKATIEGDARNKLNNVDFILYEVEEIKKNGIEEDYEPEEAIEEFKEALEKAEKHMKGSRSASYSP